MLSYPINEAEELLASKLAAAKKSLENCEEDLDFLREQITVYFLLIVSKRLDEVYKY
jgi:Na+/phosphate symporter